MANDPFTQIPPAADERRALTGKILRRAHKVLLGALACQH
jgi:hypothetical protein